MKKEQVFCIGTAGWKGDSTAIIVNIVIIVVVEVE